MSDIKVQYFVKVLQKQSNQKYMGLREITKITSLSINIYYLIEGLVRQTYRLRYMFTSKRKSGIVSCVENSVNPVILLILYLKTTVKEEVL